MQILNEAEQVAKANTLEQLYEQFYPKVYGCARLFLKGDLVQDAEDISQEIFSKVWLKFADLQERIKSVDEWRNFLFIMTRNYIINLQKRKSQAISLVVNDEDLNKYVDYDDRIAEKEMEMVISRAINALPNRQREIYLLNYYRIPRAVIANRLSISQSTVNNSLTVAKRKVETCINTWLVCSTVEWELIHSN